MLKSVLADIFWGKMKMRIYIDKVEYERMIFQYIVLIKLNCLLLNISIPIQNNRNIPIFVHYCIYQYVN